MEERVTRILAVVPTYNEAGNVTALLSRLVAVEPTIEVLVVDDDSPDGTGSLVADFARSEPRVHLLTRSEKTGLGDASRAGFDWADARGFDVLIQMDSDLSHDPAAIPALVAAVEGGAGLTIGSRYAPGGAIPNWPRRRRVMSWLANRYACVLLGLPIRDVTSGFRAWRMSTLRSTRYGNTRSTGYVFLPELAFRAKLAGARIAEVPITFLDRTQGRSKMSLAIMAESMIWLTAWGIAARFRHQRFRIIDLGQGSRRPDDVRTGDPSRPVHTPVDQ
jgi:dolichol-phosphate mannosyltransferase